MKQSLGAGTLVGATLDRARGFLPERVNPPIATEDENSKRKVCSGSSKPHESVARRTGESCQRTLFFDMNIPGCYNHL